MVTLPNTIKRFYINQTGEITGLQYAGYFAVKVMLTLGEKLEVEKIYSQLLPNDKVASSDNKLLAATLAELQVRIVDCPEWWTRSNNGKNLLDTQIVWALIIKIQELTEEWKNEVAEIVSKISQAVPQSSEDLKNSINSSTKNENSKKSEAKNS